MLIYSYKSDVAVNASIKFIYAYDIDESWQKSGLNTFKQMLDYDLRTINEYFTRWRLRSNLCKTKGCVFYLNNKHSNHLLNVTFCRHTITHNLNPKYLGITLGKTHYYMKHLFNVVKKINSLNNTIHKFTCME